MALDKYEGPASVLFDGSLLAEAKNIRVSGASGNTPVKTMKKQLAGRSKGAYTASLVVENAVPVAGLEQEYVEKCVANADVTIVYIQAGKRYQYDGWIDSVEQGNDTESDATFSFTMMAGPPRIL